MSNLIETIHYQGFDIEFRYDEDAQSPDDWGNDDAFLVYDHRQFYVERKGFAPEDIYEAISEGKKIYEGYYVFPVYAYIHSGVALSLGNNSYPFTCPWDTSMKGFCLVKRTKGWTWTNKKAYEAAKSIIADWNQYLSGDVWGYNWDHGGCWGYYDTNTIPEILPEIKAEIDHHIKT